MSEEFKIESGIQYQRKGKMKGCGKYQMAMKKMKPGESFFSPSKFAAASVHAASISLGIRGDFRTAREGDGCRVFRIK